MTFVPSISSQNSFVNVIPNQFNVASSANTFIGHKYSKDQCDGDIGSGNFLPSIVSSASFRLPTSFFAQSNLSQIPADETLNVLSTHAQGYSVPESGAPFSIHSLSSNCLSLTSSQPQIHGNSVLSQSENKTITMQQNPLVLKQGTSSGQVGMQPGMVTVPMTVNSSMPGGMQNVMTLNKPGGQNVVVTTQNLGTAEPAMLPNVQILNMRPGTPTVAAQKSVATVSPRVVIGTPQVVGTRAAAPGVSDFSIDVVLPALHAS